jgi:hypothetical protein
VVNNAIAFSPLSAEIRPAGNGLNDQIHVCPLSIIAFSPCLTGRCHPAVCMWVGAFSVWTNWKKITVEQKCYCSSKLKCLIRTCPFVLSVGSFSLDHIWLWQQSGEFVTCSWKFKYVSVFIPSVVTKPTLNLKCFLQETFPL